MYHTVIYNILNIQYVNYKHNDKYLIAILPTYCISSIFFIKISVNPLCALHNNYFI